MFFLWHIGAENGLLNCLYSYWGRIDVVPSKFSFFIQSLSHCDMETALHELHLGRADQGDLGKLFYFMQISQFLTDQFTLCLFPKTNLKHLKKWMQINTIKDKGGDGWEGKKADRKNQVSVAVGLSVTNGWWIWPQTSERPRRRWVVWCVFSVQKMKTYRLEYKCSWSWSLRREGRALWRPGQHLSGHRGLGRGSHIISSSVQMCSSLDVQLSARLSWTGLWLQKETIHMVRITLR